MIARAIAASAPFKWVAGDTIYGVGDIEQQLRRAGKGCVLGVSSAHVFRSWGKRQSVAGEAEDIARARHPSDWKRLSAGAGTKGPRLHDWCYLELADLEVEKAGIATDGLWTRGLLIRHHIADGDLAFFTTWCPTGTSVETLVAIEGHRWAIEDSFEAAKNEFGLDHNESRSWHGWHRHVSLVMLACHDGGDPSPCQSNAAKKTKTPNRGENQNAPAASLIRWSIQEVRRIAIRLARKRIQPAHIIAWSFWRRVHQAAAQRAHIRKRQL
jgi:SRSO17 transposase